MLTIKGRTSPYGRPGNDQIRLIHSGGDRDIAEDIVGNSDCYSLLREYDFLWMACFCRRPNEVFTT